MEIKLPSGRCIGDGHPPFIIAEIGSNFIDLESCLQSIYAAKECGADAAKFQLYTHQSLYGLPGEMRGQLRRDWFPALKDQAKSLGIELMCSAFSPEEIRFVDEFVNLHKCASAEMCHVRMLETLRELGKPVIMSTGAHTTEEMRQSVDILGGLPKVLLYCVAAYPANEVNLDCISNFKRVFNCLTGYSDHTTDVAVIPRAAITQGAVVLEKHFTALPELNSPDRGHSLTPGQFKRMVDCIRNGSTGDLGPNAEESPMTSRHNRRLIAIHDILPGEMFKEGTNFGIYRSLKNAPQALSPFAINDVHGKVAKRALGAGDAITKEDV